MIGNDTAGISAHTKNAEKLTAPHISIDRIFVLSIDADNDRDSDKKNGEQELPVSSTLLVCLT